MNLLQPFALWGLLALALPLALHLRRRRVGRTVQVGSVRHLESLPTAERRGLRLREPWLLLLRSAIIALLVLLLAKPMLDRPARNSGAIALVDSAAPSTLRDSLGREATLLVERIDDPWRRVAELDDSLGAGMPLIVAASNSSDHFAGPRPTVTRPVTWIPVAVPPAETRPVTRDSRPAIRLTTVELRAVSAAISAVAEELGPLKDTTGWMARLPEWWRDSLATSSFPVAVARAIAPTRTRPAPLQLPVAQVLPRLLTATRGGPTSQDLHWPVWALVFLLFAAERLWSLRRHEVA